MAGGRPKGSTNKRSSYARLRLDDLGCDPIKEAVTCANKLRDEGELDKAGRIYNDLIAYIAPKLKAMEISQDVDNPVRFSINIGGKSAD